MDLTSVLSLTPTPPANAFVSEAALDKPQDVFPLDLFFCEKCSHLQLLDVVDPSVLFADYVYVSGTSPVFVAHFNDYADSVIKRFQPNTGDFVLDIGSNDGTLLGFFKNAGMTVLGVDPARDIAVQANKNGVETITDFFTPSLAKKILAEKGYAQIITANNVFAHADDLAGIAQGTRELLAPSGVFVFEVSYFLDVYEQTLFDTIYHEHLAYHTVRGIVQHAGGPHRVGASVAQRLSEEKSLKLDNSETLQQFAVKIDTIKQELTALLDDFKGQGKSIAGFGAPAKATTLMYHFGLGADVVDFVVDDSPLKQGLYTPGQHIPVVPSSVLYDRMPDYALILAWNFAEPIMNNHEKFQQAGGKFIVPLPNVQVH
jgi:SAM-dependent methyltransferase